MCSAWARFWILLTPTTSSASVFYHLVPTGRGVEVQTLTQEEARNAMDTLIARVEEWKAEGKTVKC